ncbi:hypothetical protein DPMN_073718 [Dreissena polymorpha]|uniref:Uncharacterized protein n=1 Tax=Dreissena polymorpha TaxID=45954 RepID=A0A9D4BZI2_DREPO|nr:hypothetical protein DPMN_073718 [Dreissena polymorpha]
MGYCGRIMVRVTAVHRLCVFKTSTLEMSQTTTIKTRYVPPRNAMTLARIGTIPTSLGSLGAVI